MTKRYTFKTILIIFSAVFVLSGCYLFTKPLDRPNIPDNEPNANLNQGTSETGGKPVTVDEQLVAQSKIKKFTNLDELQEFLEEGGAGESYSYGRGIGMIENMVALEAETMADVSWAAPMAKTAEAISGMEGASDDFSETNVQVEGVDEADIIKTDGKYIYAVVKNDLYIVNAYPTDNAEVLTKIEFKSRPNDIYINNDRLVIFGQDTEIYRIEPYSNWRQRGNYTFFKVFDITDRKNPKQVRDLGFEGSYYNSRMIGDYVYLVTQNYNYYYIDDEPLLPRILDGGEEIDRVCVNQAASCVIPDIYYFDIPYYSYNFISVNAINIADKESEITGDVYLMSGSQNMYVSPNNIYITYTKYISEYQLMMEVTREIVYPRLSQKDQDKIAKIEAVDNFILNLDEKMAKIGQIIERYQYGLTDEEQEDLENEVDTAMKQKYKDISKELEKTVIHKVGINQGNIEYQTSGEVTGDVLNQFSMDENASYFRIATTKNRTWSRYLDIEDEQRESYSNIYVLDENLKQVGAVENLAPGERIYSVRFMQGRAYLVTFKQIDPLFVVDLSNPRAPKVLGELKIPGFSNYLHPYDDTTLIGIGKDTGESEWGGVRVKGIKISLFDVSDVRNPKEADVYVMGDAGSDSIALNDHKAFLFSKDKNLLALPVSIRESLDGSSYGKLTFSGAAIFNITKDSLELKGKIDHSDGGRASDSDYWRGYSYYDNTVKRSLYINDTLYTFSNKYIKMNKLEDLSAVKSLELKKERQDDGDDFIIIN